MPECESHEATLNALKFELNERKRLAKNISDLRVKKELLEKENKIRTNELAKLDSDLDAILTASLPLQEILGIQLTKRRRQDIQAALLPPSLLALYQKAQASNLAWEIIGDREEAKSFKLSEPLSPENIALDSTLLDDEANNHRLSKKNPETYLLSKHPLDFVIRLVQKQNVTLKLTFSYYDKLNRVGVLLGGEKNASLTDLSPSFVLHELFDDHEDGDSSSFQLCSWPERYLFIS
jgi:hypothetical protein